MGQHFMVINCISRDSINLINNSIDHNEINPSIKITFSKIENNLMIDYMDDGRGLSQIILMHYLNSRIRRKQSSTWYRFIYH